MAFNPMDYSNKDLVLDVVRTERGRFYDIIDNPANWNVDTRCEGWEVRDIVGHMIDVTEGYLARWAIAEKGDEAPGALGWVVMASKLNDGALAFRLLSRDEAIARLKSSSDKLMAKFEGLSEDEWYNFQVAHVFSGPVASMFYPAFQIMDYTVHTWDMVWGLGDKHAKLDERSAGVLVPYMFIIWMFSVDQAEAEGVDVTYGVKVDGEWGGTWRLKIKDGQFSYEAVEELGDVDALYHYRHPSDMVLTTYQRIAGGETSGDPAVIDKLGRVFFQI